MLSDREQRGYRCSVKDKLQYESNIASCMYVNAGPDNTSATFELASHDSICVYCRLMVYQCFSYWSLEWASSEDGLWWWDFKGCFFLSTSKFIFITWPSDVQDHHMLTHHHPLKEREWAYSQATPKPNGVAYIKPTWTVMNSYLYLHSTMTYVLYIRHAPYILDSCLSGVDDTWLYHLLTVLFISLILDFLGLQ